ncbi:helix-turn-helix domain-containing protein [Marilutibacter aestuarii]|uniref:Helix-turn-helix domain-containing protein n=1 Tax=Marilutibacter aestuarii TaxID=1706195 RepID=A0A508AL30_9GAMM|nr:helix-turn-helix domain-containing protein [Lysobacter aestuarii]
MNELNPTQSGPASGGADVSCGARLRLAREAAGLTREDVASRLKMPARIVQALENDDWSALGATIFVRGQLRSYARLLKLDLDVDACLDRAEVAPVAPPELVSYSHTPRYRRVMEQATKRAVYIVMTLALAVPVWFYTGPHLGRKAPATQSLEVPDDIAVLSPAPAEPSQAPTVHRTPVVASMTPRAASVDDSDGDLVLKFTGESWVELFDAQGRSVEKGLLAAGEERRFEAGEVASVKLGNAAAVDVTADGESLDLAPFSRGTVARFKLSSDGSVVPASE